MACSLLQCVPKILLSRLLGGKDEETFLVGNSAASHHRIFLGRLQFRTHAPTGEQYQITKGGGTNPLWSPDGKEIIYQPAGKLMGKLMSVHVRINEGYAVIRQLDPESLNIQNPN